MIKDNTLKILNSLSADGWSGDHSCVGEKDFQLVADQVQELYRVSVREIVQTAHKIKLQVQLIEKAQLEVGGSGVSRLEVINSYAELINTLARQMTGLPMSAILQKEGFLISEGSAPKAFPEELIERFNKIGEKLKQNNIQKCPSCGSEATGIAFGKFDCFNCGYKN